MADLDLSQLSSLKPTHPDWIGSVLADFDAFLLDHASAEKKASGMAMSMISHYPDQPALVLSLIHI